MSCPQNLQFAGQAASSGAGSCPAAAVRCPVHLDRGRLCGHRQDCAEVSPPHRHADVGELRHTGPCKILCCTSKLKLQVHTRGHISRGGTGRGPRLPCTGLSLQATDLVGASLSSWLPAGSSDKPRAKMQPNPTAPFAGVRSSCRPPVFFHQVTSKHQQQHLQGSSQPGPLADCHPGRTEPLPGPPGLPGGSRKLLRGAVQRCAGSHGPALRRQPSSGQRAGAGHLHCAGAAPALSRRKFNLLAANMHCAGAAALLSRHSIRCLAAEMRCAGAAPVLSRHELKALAADVRCAGAASEIIRRKLKWLAADVQGHSMGNTDS